MKYPDYFELSSLEGIKAFLAEDLEKKRPFISDQEKKNLFRISFRMTNQYGRINKNYRCIGYSQNWQNEKTIKLRFEKVK